MGGCLGEYRTIIYQIYLENTFCKMYYLLFYRFCWFTLTHILDSSKLLRCLVFNSINLICLGLQKRKEELFNKIFVISLCLSHLKQLLHCFLFSSPFLSLFSHFQTQWSPRKNHLQIYKTENAHNFFYFLVFFLLSLPLYF